MPSPVVRGNSLYTVVDGPSWTEAEANSVKLGGHLVTINDAAENEWLKGIVPDDSVSGYGGAWIGLSDHNQEGLWRWSSGINSTFTNWSPGQPGNDWGGQDYALLGRGGFWDDVNPQPNFGSQHQAGGIAETTFIRRGDSAYVIVQGPTWEEAEANAVKLGGHLVTINDAAENEWISNQNWKENGKSIWIGASDKEQEGVWKWSDGSNFDYANWGNGAPNGGVADEDYAQIPFGGEWNGKVWNDDYNGDTRFGFVTNYGIAEIKLAPNNTPTGTPTLSGTLKVGQTITINKTPIQDADNFTGYTPTFNYSFEVSNDNGATWTKLISIDATDNNSTYTLTTAEVGKKVRGVVSYLDGYGTYEVVDSDASVSVVNGDIGSTTTTATKTTTLASTISRLTLTGTRNINGTGNALNNYLTGNAGNNILDSGAGYDILAGGRGNDTYIVDSTYDSIIENANEGTDTVKASANWTLGANLENLTLIGAANLSGTGNELDNVITGNSGNNSLYGGGGNDKLNGMAGDDNLWVDVQGDSNSGKLLLDGGVGNDNLWVTVQGDNNVGSFSMNGGDGDDNLWATVQGDNNFGSATISLDGGKGNDNIWFTVQGDNNSGTIVLSGGGGDDSLYVTVQGDNNRGNFTLNGSSGNDILGVSIQGDNNTGKTILNGGAGNDTYYVDSAASTITDASGTDTVISSASWTLGSNLENLTLSGTDALTGIGNSLKNTIIGNAGNNVLDGMGGTDILTGGAGADTFRFSTKPKFGASTADHITDFNASEGDLLQISKSAFGMASNATASLTTVGSASELTAALGSTSTFVYDSSNGNLYWNQNGNKSGFGTGGIFGVLDNHSALSASNISLF
jgi:Ca2+-binding RTX toxin-like protein